MKNGIINLEINELPPAVLKEYIKHNNNSIIARLSNKRKLNIFSTFAKDIDKKDLYPSQTWASYNTGLPFKEHKCYWYSDPINRNQLIWNKLAKENISVGIIGSLHSSKYPSNFLNDKNYQFYLPDCFTDDIQTKPKYYKRFCNLNAKLVSASARITNTKNIWILLFEHIRGLLLKPRRYGISIYSLKSISKIVIWSLINKNKEFLRMAQFPLISSIYIDQLKTCNPKYSSIFSNHVAGNMHRYWYAYKPIEFKIKNRYKESWIKRNHKVFFYSLDLLDDFLNEIFKQNLHKNNTILISSSMGQEANPKFDNYVLSKYDAKISDINLFIDKFFEFQKIIKYNFDFELQFIRNMAPQYGFEIISKDMTRMKEIKSLFVKFLESLNLKSKIDQNKNFITLTIDIASNIEFQKAFTIKQARSKYEKYGFEFSKIEDHHSGAHSEEGLLAIIENKPNFLGYMKKHLKENSKINYLEVSKLIYKYLVNKNKP